MSAQTIVSMGVWILVMVLVGTMTVGVTLAFYLAMTAFFGVIVAVLTVITRRRLEQAERS